MAGNKMSLKLFLKKEVVLEARRIFIDEFSATSFLYIKEKFETIFPILKNAQFKITWRDDDGDDITIATDEDLITAFTEMSSDVKVLIIQILQHPGHHSVERELSRHTIICDGCDKTIIDLRYKCAQCPDYDLCSDCEFQGLHPNHVMVRIPNIEIYSPGWGPKFVNHIARSLKKSAHHASKHAHRVAKHHCKHGKKYKPSDVSNYETDTDNGEVHPVEQDHLMQNACKNKEPFGSFDVLCEAVAALLNPAPQTQPSASTEAGPKATDNVLPTSENDSTPMEVNVSSAPAPLEPLNTVECNPDIPNNSNAKFDKPSNQPPWTFLASPIQQPQTNVSEAPQNTPPEVAFIYHENPTIAEGLVTLYEMGFSNENGVLTNLLEHFNGNVTQVIMVIVDKKL